jgi:hypothetical protein
MPILFVIAGPNGIGKTTSSYDLLPANASIINSDDLKFPFYFTTNVFLSFPIPVKVNDFHCFGKEVFN